MSGTYVVEGIFRVESGATIYITPFSSNGCGALKIYAEDIVIEGDIVGDFAGYSGGAGGEKGTAVSSITGHGVSLTSCNDSGSEGHISIEGGIGGDDGFGPGGGNGGGDGLDGNGTKQYCGNVGDEAGVVAGSGGAGGGAGGSYGGTGSAGMNGGSGSAGYTPNGIDVENSYSIVSGNGGLGGSQSMVYGTETGRDIDLGSGGAGAGGGGRSHYFGTNGGDGGAGGGLVFLKATNSLTITGNISVNGEDGTYGGAGGSGDATADCCSDGCNGCDERTFSCGSGAGSGSGGGSGGGVFIESAGVATISGTIEAKGGAGGFSGQKGFGAECNYDGGPFCGSHGISTSDGSVGGEGGAGGGGRVKIFVADCSQANITATVVVTGASEGTFAEVCGFLETKELMSEQWMIFPNPFESQIQIVGSNLIEGLYPAQIVSTTGKIVSEFEISKGKTTVDLQYLPSGFYFVYIGSEDNQTVHKIIKK